MHFLSRSLPPPPKNKKIHLEKNSLYFGKWNFLAVILKKILYFLKEKVFLYFLKRSLFLYFRKWIAALCKPKPRQMKQKNSPCKKFLIFREMELFKLKTEKKSLYFRKWNPALFSPRSRNKKHPPWENFLYFRKRKPRKNFWHFVKKSCSYVSGKQKPEKIPYTSGNRTFRARKVKRTHS